MDIPTPHDVAELDRAPSPDTLEMQEEPPVALTEKPPETAEEHVHGANARERALLQAQHEH